MCEELQQEYIMNLHSPKRENQENLLGKEIWKPGDSPRSLSRGYHKHLIVMYENNNTGIPFNRIY